METVDFSRVVHHKRASYSHSAQARARAAGSSYRSSSCSSSQPQAAQALASAALACSRLVLTEGARFDFHSPEGLGAASSFLRSVEWLSAELMVPVQSRLYRCLFSSAYRDLFHSDRCYIPELLQSAYDEIASIWVNGHQYAFRTGVRAAGRDLVAVFAQLSAALASTPAASATEAAALTAALTRFDECWAEYERLLITELILIEDAALKLSGYQPL